VCEPNETVDSPERRRVLKWTAGAVAATAVGAAVLERTGTDAGTRDDAAEEGQPNATGGDGAPPTAHHVTPEEGFERIQRVIEQHGPNVTISLGEGEYVGSRLRLKHGVQLVGSGRNATTVRLADGADEDLVVAPNPDRQNVMQVRFERLTFDGNRANNSKGALVYGAFWNGRFVDCDFVDAPAEGFWLAGSSETSTDDNVFRGCRFIDAGADGLRQGVNRTSYPAVGITRVESCWFGENEGRAVRIRGNGNVVSRCKFYGNRGTDVLVDRGRRNQVVGNDLSKPQPTGSCIVVKAEQDTAAASNRVGGNVLSGAYRDAIRCETDGAPIVAMRIHDNVVVGDSDVDGANRTGVNAVGERYDGCAAQDNTFSGSFGRAPIRAPPSWRTSDNVGVGG
jgi:hypothetical protein